MGNLTIIGFTDEQYKNKAPAPGAYKAMLNPDSIERGAQVIYAKPPAGDTASDTAPQFSDIGGQTLAFDLVIDCTGVVDGTRTDLEKELATLYGVLYTYRGTIHRPNFVKVVWGTTLHFKGVLTRIDLTYTFFKPDGTALRARVKLQFSSYIDPVTLSRMKNNKSPDVTHHVLVREGDSLPMIAHGIYGSVDYAIALARANRLDKFRHLEAGTTLLAPPLAAPGAIHG